MFRLKGGNNENPSKWLLIVMAAGYIRMSLFLLQV